MNIQAMMKQAQKLQNDMLNEKKQIDERHLPENCAYFDTLNFDVYI